MPAKDIFHDTVKTALEKDGWVIIRENFLVRLDDSSLNMFVDLAAQKLISAEKKGQKILVEIKSFQEESKFYQFHLALGQFLNYRSAVGEVMPDWMVYLAVPLKTYNEFFQKRFIQKQVAEYNLKLLVFNPSTEEIVLWKH